MAAAEMITLLGWMPVSRRLNASLAASVTTAENAGADEVGIEHLLSALLEDVDATVYLATRGVKLDPLRAFCVDKIKAASPAREDAGAAARTPQTTSSDLGASPASNDFNSATRESFGDSAGFDSARNSHGYSANDGYRGSSAGFGQSSSGFGRTDSSFGRDRTGYGDNNSGFGQRSAPGYTQPNPSYTRAAAPHSGYSDNMGDGEDLQYGGRAAAQSGFAPRTAAPADAAAPKPPARRAPQASPSLRKLMARASEFTETLQRVETTSDLVVRAIACDAGTEAGRFLRSMLSVEDVQPPKPSGLPVAAPQTALAKEQKKDAKPKEAQPAFGALLDQATALENMLESELQKDRRYRIANDLRAYVASHDGQVLGASAQPILRNAHQELMRDPQFRAYEQLRATLSNIRREQTLMTDALDALVATGAVSEAAPLIRCAQKLVAFDAENGSQPAAAPKDADEHAGAAAPTNPQDTPADEPPKALAAPGEAARVAAAERARAPASNSATPVAANEREERRGFDLFQIFGRSGRRDIGLPPEPDAGPRSELVRRR